MSTASKYYRFSCCDGLEALAASHHKTPFPSHFHSTFNLSLIQDGAFSTQLNDRLIITPAGSLLITNPDEIHANPGGHGVAVSFFTFYISKDYVEYCSGNHPVYFSQKTINDPFLFALFYKCSQKLRENKVDNIENEFTSALQLLITTHAVVPDAGENKQGLFKNFLLEENLEKFSLADTARRFGMDKFKFIRLFKSQTGLTPTSYFIYRRIEKSKAMLLDGKDLLTIAIELGFYDAAHYSNHFRKLTGISPVAFVKGT